MLRATIRLGLVLLVLLPFLAPCAALRSSNSKSYGNDSGFNKPKTLAGTSSGLPSQNSTRRGLGISAWGIVILVVSIIVAAPGSYNSSLPATTAAVPQPKHRENKTN